MLLIPKGKRLQTFKQNVVLINFLKRALQKGKE